MKMKIFVTVGVLMCCINIAFGVDTSCTMFNTTTCVLSNANSKTQSDGSVSDSANTAIEYVVIDGTASEFILQSVFDKFQNVKELAIPFGNIKNLVKEFGTLRQGTSSTSNDLKLEKLQIKNSELKTVTSKAFEKCIALLHLDLSHNKIDTFESGFDFSLTKLLSLNLAFNKIVSFSTPTTLLTKLEVFNISGNALTAVGIPTESVLLKLIDLSKNKIATITKEQFKNYPNLVEIRLEENSFTALDIDLFKDHASLKILSVGGNTLTSWDFLIKATKLDTLNISKTAISQLSEKTFETITDLRYLYISHNKLTHLPTSALKKNTKLEMLDVSGNRINHVDHDLFDVLTSIKAANFSCNQCISENFGSKPTAEQIKVCNSSPSIIISTALTFIFVAITKML
jgi:Leucine-rich repeat (LRR) protein